MLPRRWSLHDVEDVEALCGRVLDERLKRFGAVLRPDDRADALAYLLAEAWMLSGKWDPAKGVPSFSTFAYRRLRFAVVNWFRERFGDSRYSRRIPEALTLSLDAATGKGRSDLGELVAARASDPADGCDPDLARLLEEAGCQRARDLAEVRRLVAERAP